MFCKCTLRNISQTLRWYALRSWRQRPSARQHKVGELTPQKRPVLALTRNAITRRSANAGPRFDHFLAPRGPHRRGVGAAGFGAGRDPRGAHCRNSVNDALHSSTDVVAENAARPHGWCSKNRKSCASPTPLRYDLERDAPWMGGRFALQKGAPTFSRNTLFPRTVRRRSSISYGRGGAQIALKSCIASPLQSQINAPVPTSTSQRVTCDV